MAGLGCFAAGTCTAAVQSLVIPISGPHEGNVESATH